MNRRKAVFGLLALTVSSGICSLDTKAVDLGVEAKDLGIEKTIKKDEKKAIVNENLNLRTEPLVKSNNIILTMKKGSAITILSRDGQWAKVKYGNKEGYASLKYISESDVNAKTGVVKRVKVNTANLNVRAGASTKYKIIGVVKQNAILEVYGFNNSWTKIKYNGKDGYVSTKYVVDVVEESSNLNKKMEVVNAVSLNVRSGPGNNYSIKGKLSKGECINVLSINNGWARFIYKNADAYVSASYLKEVSMGNDTNDANDTVVDTSINIEKTMYVSATKTSVRSGEGNNYSILGTLKQNDSVYVKKQMSSGWSQVTYNNKIAYILTKDLANEPTNPPVEAEVETGVNLESYKQEVLRLVNIERAKEGLCALSMDYTLSNVAQLKSQDMIDNDYFAHNSPIYGTPFEMMKSHGITYRVAGENIAMGHSTPQEVVNGWMNSEGHRKNIMNGRFTNLGMGIAQSSSGRIYWTQMFTGHN